MDCAFTQELEKAYQIKGFKKLYDDLKKQIPMIQMLKELKQTEQLKQALRDASPAATKLKDFFDKHPEINPSLIDLDR